MCAMLGGKSVATTMSFTPADGLVMGTRAGSLDPGVLLYLMTRHGMDARALEHLIYHESGLLGVSGVSGDMRQVHAAARGGDARARLALDVYARRLRQTIGGYAATLRNKAVGYDE